MELTELIKQFSEEMELGVSLASEEGNYSLPLEENVDLKIAPSGQGYRFLCQFASVPKIERETLFSHMMHANLFAQGTRGGVLGATEDGNAFILSKVVPNETDYKEFKEALEDFVYMVDFWRAEAIKYK